MIMRVSKTLNHDRLVLLQKGFLQKKDIAVFVPCGRTKAKEIYEDIRGRVKAEGFENVRNVIHVKRLLDYMGLKASDIERAAKSS